MFYHCFVTVFEICYDSDESYCCSIFQFQGHSGSLSGAMSWSSRELSSMALNPATKPEKHEMGVSENRGH